MPLHEMIEHETFEVELQSNSAVSSEDNTSPSYQKNQIKIYFEGVFHSVLTKTANLKVWNKPEAKYVYSSLNFSRSISVLK